jgi:hypothetical protein
VKAEPPLCWLRFILPAETDLAATFGLRGRSHELADGFDQLPDCVVMSVDAFLQFVELAGQLLCSVTNWRS